MSYNVKKLQEGGYLIQSRSSDDRRTVRLKLTPSGKAVRNRVAGSFREAGVLARAYRFGSLRRSRPAQQVAGPPRALLVRPDPLPALVHKHRPRPDSSGLFNLGRRRTDLALRGRPDASVPKPPAFARGRRICFQGPRLLCGSDPYACAQHHAGDANSCPRGRQYSNMWWLVRTSAYCTRIGSLSIAVSSST